MKASKMLYRIFVVSLGITVVYSTNVRQCEEIAAPLPEKVILGPCPDNDQECVVSLGSSLPQTIIFTPEKEVQWFYAEIVVYADDGTTQMLPIPDDNLCQNVTNTECPLKAGVTATYKDDRTAEEDQKPGNFTFEFALVAGETNEPIVCHQVDLYIKAAE